MKWLFILLLLCNVFYFGWEIDRQTKITIRNSSAAIAIPEGTEKLKLLSELGEPPALITTQAEQPIPADEKQEEKVDTREEDVPGMKVGDSTVGDNEPPDIGLELLQSLPGVNISELTKDLDQAKPLCFTYGPMPDAAESDRLEDWFRSRHVWVNHRLTDDKGRQLFWIYLTARDSRENAMAAIRDLKNRGVTDLRLISTGELVNAISLGLFSTQAAVNRRLRQITDKGYKPVVIPHYGEKKIHWLDIRLDKNAPVLNEIIDSFPARYNSVPVACNEIAMSTVNP
ncbi:MAG: hypothetical protein A2W28_08740 [Gammaproteobacteria bacterium RBG_16_51_14]|nr:MAG: hypothetical protein A2W28_08740 [Gammaproteobacteria bacterium RBG_16_51_14]